MELKFRAWHKERKRYYEVATLDFYEEVIGLVLSLWGEPSYEPGIGYISTKTVVEVEYVLLDEVIIEKYLEYDEHNKRDVYVGDIYWNDRCQDYFIIIWNEDHHAVGYSWIYDNSIDLNWEGISIDNRYVGSIHEKEELL